MVAIFYTEKDLGTRLVGNFKWPVLQPERLFSDRLVSCEGKV